MFGKRKDPNSPGEPTAPQLSGSPRPPAGPPAGPSAGGEETPARPGGPGARTPQGQGAGGPAKGPARRAESRGASAVEGRKLVVGREICLSGEIKTCEKLVVEGRVEADLRDSHSLEISEPGLFKGTATVVDCEISGTFEGDLTVTGLLVVLPSGRVSGKIRYAEMELSRGARLSGDIDMLDEAALRRARGEGPTLAHDNDTGDAGKSRIG
ncbi:MAG: polymer-forming cytoskeletal protein [Kiloniellaceae bacterium]